jgi:stage II sporulation protein AA (anti-sigma F factor antagonist)
MKIGTSYDTGVFRVTFEGELDHHAAQEAVRAIEDGIETHLPVCCVLDLLGLTFMDSSGIAVILKAQRRMGEAGGRARVENARRQPMKVMEMAGLDRLVDISAAAGDDIRRRLS